MYLGTIYVFAEFWPDQTSNMATGQPSWNTYFSPFLTNNTSLNVDIVVTLYEYVSRHCLYVDQVSV
jgi:hypothetical protein